MAYFVLNKNDVSHQIVHFEYLTMNYLRLDLESRSFTMFRMTKMVVQYGKIIIQGDKGSSLR